jgi:hypothetical protein
MHPFKRIVAATEILERTRASLVANEDSLVGYEREYLAIIDGLIGMMKSAQNAHWFKMTGDKTWSTRDRWKLDALRIAETLVGEYHDKDTEA